jgi:PPE-repeat protein
MFYGAFPPEFNSGRMYAGPGSESMLAAAVAWDELAMELQSTSSSYATVISGLTSSPWLGPSSMSMAAAATPYVAWLQQTAAQAHLAASKATEAASAYETAFAATVPPPVIEANRAYLSQLVATNILGQNTSEIAATEAQYSEFWAKDAAAMDTYFASSATASNSLPTFNDPPQTTSDAAGLMQSSALLNTTNTSAGTAASTLSSIVPSVTPEPGALGWLAGLANAYTDFGNNFLNALFGANGSTTIPAFYNALKVPLGLTTQFNDIGLLINFPVSQWLKFSPPVAYGALPKDALGAGLGALGFGRGTLYSEITGGMGNAGTLVGKLSVPPSWATATPAIRTVAAALTAAGPEAVPAAALGEGGLFSSMAMAGMLGSALGSGGPTVAGAAVRGRMTQLKDLKDKKSPEQLKRLVAQISEKPESVQHHNVDQEGLDALLEQLAKKPGIHAVHLKKGDKSKVLPSEAQLG